MYRILICVLPLVYYLILVLLFDFNGLYGQDSYEYLRIAKAIKNYTLSGTHPGSFFWPVGYPMIGAFFSIVFVDVNFTMQLISFATFFGSMFMVSKIICYFQKEASTDSIYLYLLLVLCFSPFYLRNAFVVMSDMPAIFFSLTAIYFMFAFNLDAKARFLYYIAFFVSLALITRYAALSIMIVPVFYFIFKNYKSIRTQHIIYSIIIIALCFLPGILIKGIDFSYFSSVDGWNLKHFFSSSFKSESYFRDYQFINLIQVLQVFAYPGFLSAGILLLIFIKRKDFYSADKIMLVCIIAFYLSMLAGLPKQNDRFLLMVLPFIVILLYPSFKRLYTYINHTPKLASTAIFAFLLIQIALTVYAILPLYKMNQEDKEVVNYIKQLDNEKPVYAFVINLALETYELKNPIINVWEKEHKSFQEGAYFLYQEKHFNIKVEEHKPKLNWENINLSNELIKINKFESGWELYEIY